jgi:diamine N-acetyltransferase
MRPPIRLEVLNRFNWEQVLKVEIKPEQLAFVPSVLYSLAQAAFEKQDAWGVRLEDEIVGLILVGKVGSMSWISRVYVDGEYQGLGIGTEALSQLLGTLSLRSSEIRTSFSRTNIAAERLFTRLGFEPLPDAFSEEIVLSYSAFKKKNPQP